MSSGEVKRMTFYGLSRWYSRAFKKLGWMILAIERGDYEKLAYYERMLKQLSDSLREKRNETTNEDQRSDLKIMHDNVRILRNHVEKLRTDEEFQMFVQGLPFSIESSEE